MSETMIRKPLAPRGRFAYKATAPKVETDFAALFGLEFAPEADLSKAASDIKAFCDKCSGSGNFIGYTGRVVGPCFTCQGSGLHASLTETPKLTAEIDVTKIAAAFAAARVNHVEKPMLRLGGYIFSRAPDHGKNPGAIYVKQGSQYLGKILDSSFSPTSDCTLAMRTEIVAIAADPAAAAIAYGRRTNNCSCCNRKLTNKLSVDLGIGPICRENFGW
jgi:hypothetical protein